MSHKGAMPHKESYKDTKKMTPKFGVIFIFYW